MQILIDKFLIFICCGTWMLLVQKEPAFNSVAALFLAFGCSCFLSYLNPDGTFCKDYRQKPFLLILPAVYTGICFFLPDAVIFLPVIFYDVLFTGFYLLYPFGIVACIYCVSDMTQMHLFLLVLQFVLALVLHLRTKRILDLNQQIRALRDDSTEYNRMLVAKNHALLEKQDYEIHLATLKERNRIAREIHDNVGHMLSRSILQAGALIAINHDEHMTEPLHALTDTLNLAMNNIRESVHDLHDEAVDLESAARQMLDDYHEYTIQFDYDMSRSVEKNVKYCFISITKEALSNITKHSNATRIAITMREHPSLYQLLIEDNGTNIILRNSGIGLTNMQERVDNLGGTLTINTENGFRIFISVPKS